MKALCNKQPVELTIDDGSNLVVQAGKAPVIDGIEEQRMRVGCGSATIGIFAQQWHGEADEVVVVDDHITGVLSEHQAGKVLHMPSTGIRMRGRRSTPGRYFQVAEPGSGWGGTDIKDPLEIIQASTIRLPGPGCDDDQHDWRGRPLWPSTMTETGRGGYAASATGRRRPDRQRIASPRCRPSSSWAVPVDHCAPV